MLSMTAPSDCGFTASNATSAQATASRLSDPTGIPNRCLMTSRRSALMSVARNASGLNACDPRIPASSASAIWPAPTQANLRNTAMLSYPFGRSPKIAEPTRTIVAPSSTAIS